MLAVFVCSLAFIAQPGSAKTSHKDYAKMPIKECNECHKVEGLPLTHENDWAGKHHQDSEWMGEHRSIAGKSQTNCIDCHAQSYCNECHSGGGVDVELRKQNFQRNYVPKSHRSDFIELHPLKARENPRTCDRCHVQRFCSDCHSKFQKNDLQFESHRRQFRDIKVSSVGPRHETFSETQCQTCHSGGIVPNHKWAADHGREARRNLQACQSCHSDGDVCMKCHSSRSGLKVSPHPRNWGGIKDNFKSRSNGRTCAKCHTNF